MRKPFILYDASLDAYFVGKDRTDHVFGPKKEARGFATSALAIITARAISHETGRFINVKNSLSVEDKRVKNFKMRGGKRK